MLDTQTNNKGESSCITWWRFGLKDTLNSFLENPKLRWKIVSMTIRSVLWWYRGDRHRDPGCWYCKDNWHRNGTHIQIYNRSSKLRVTHIDWIVKIKSGGCERVTRGSEKVQIDKKREWLLNGVVQCGHDKETLVDVTIFYSLSNVSSLVYKALVPRSIVTLTLTINIGGVTITITITITDCLNFDLPLFKRIQTPFFRSHDNVDVPSGDKG